MKWLKQIGADLSEALGGQEAREHYKKGVVLHQHQCFEEALEPLRRAASLAPSWEQAQAEHGYVAFMCKRYGEAQAAYDRVLELNPGSEIALRNLYILGRLKKKELDHDAYLAYQTAVEHSAEPGERLESRVYWYRKRLQRAPRFALAHQGVGIAYLEGGRFAEAQAAFEAALEGDPDHPNNPALLHNLNQLYAQSDLEIDGAPVAEWVQHAQSTEAALDDRIASWRLVVKAVPRFAAAYHNLGECLREAGRAGEAEAAFRAALAANPWELAAAQSLGVLLLTVLGRFYDARDVFERLLALEPENRAASDGLAAIAELLEQHPQLRHYEDGLRALREQDPDAARKAFERGIAAARGERFGWEYLALAHLQAGAPARALAVLRDATEAGVALADRALVRRAGFHAARAALARADLADARAALASARGFDPSSLLLAELAAALATLPAGPARALLDAVAERAPAVREPLLRAVIESGPSALAEVGLGVSAADRGEPERAVEHYAAALGLDPASRIARLNAAGMQLVLRQRDDALTLWRAVATGDDRVAAIARSNLEAVEQRRGEIVLTLDIAFDEL